MDNDVNLDEEIIENWMHSIVDETQMEPEYFE
jgi:hypothetical protein